MKVPESELRDLANRVNERIESIDKERQEERQTEIDAALEAQVEESEETVE